MLKEVARGRIIATRKVAVAYLKGDDLDIVPDLEYVILGREYKPTLPNFVSFTSSSHLGLSEEIPEKFHAAVLSYELHRRELAQMGLPDQYPLKPSVWEIVNIDAKDFNEYAKFRDSYFSRLLLVWPEDGVAMQTLSEIERLRNYWRQLHTP